MITTPSNDGLILIFDEYIFEYVCNLKADCKWEEKMEGFEVDRLDHARLADVLAAPRLGNRVVHLAAPVEREPQATVVAEAALPIPDVALHLLREGHE